MKKKGAYFTKCEMILWCVSVLLILMTFVIFDRKNYLTLTASVIGVTSLILNAKGNPVGQLLIVIFSIMYGVISYSFAYYGEMITYLGMTAPMAVFSLISWLRNPYNGNRAQVAVNHLKRRELVLLPVPTILVTVVFYFILAYFHTTNLPLSTLSVTTSFLAVYLTFRRSKAFALAYAANDIVLILLWISAAQNDPSYLSVTACFAVFLINDLYGYISWTKMSKRQRTPKNI